MLFRVFFYLLCLNEPQNYFIVDEHGPLFVFFLDVSWVYHKYEFTNLVCYTYQIGHLLAKFYHSAGKRLVLNNNCTK